MSNCIRSAKRSRPLPSMVLSLLALPLLILSGCATQPFPNNWAQPQAALSPDGCSGLSGTYANGATAESAGLFHTLSRYPHTRTQADRVMLSTPDTGVLTVAAYNAGERVGELRFSEHEQTLACRPDGADIRACAGAATTATNRPIVASAARARGPLSQERLLILGRLLRQWPHGHRANCRPLRH